MRNIIFHCHLFKNAGTSVDHILRENFKDRWINAEFAQRGEETNADLVYSFIADNQGLAALSSHTGNWCLDEEIPGVSVHPIVFVRHPLLRVRSAYQFERTQKEDTVGSRLARSGDLRHYIRSRLSAGSDWSLRNYQARRLGFFVTRRLGNVEEQSLRAVERLPFIGRVEDFSASCRRLERYLRPIFPRFAARSVHKNVTSAEVGSIDQLVDRMRTEIGDDLMRDLIEANRIDLMLFDRIEALYRTKEPARDSITTIAGAWRAAKRWFERTDAS